jgi:N-formylglutamate amidohydrolase
MTAAFRLTPPSASHLPLVLDSPHSGCEYPADFGAAVPLDLLRQAEDSYVDELYASGPARGATLIAACFPRSYIDPNRSLLDIDAALLESAWPGPAVQSRKTELGIGLIWRLLDSGMPIYSRKLSVEEVKQRIVRYHQPYQRAVKDAIDAAHEHFGAVWHLNVHSMPAVSDSISEEGPGKPLRKSLPKWVWFCGGGCRLKGSLGVPPGTRFWGAGAAGCAGGAWGWACGWRRCISNGPPPAGDSTRGAPW